MKTIVKVVSFSCSRTLCRETRGPRITSRGTPAVTMSREEEGPEEKSKEHQRGGENREKLGFEDTMINKVSVNCWQEAGKMRTENCSLDFSNNWRLW